MTSLVAGIAGIARNTATALSSCGQVVAVCEQERVTRTRHAGLAAGQLPKEALEAVLAVAGRGQRDIDTYAIAEEDAALPTQVAVERVDHHLAHAATAFFTSDLTESAVVICDRHHQGGTTVWKADRRGITAASARTPAFALADVYSAAAEASGFRRHRDEHRFEALAQVARSGRVPLPRITYGRNGVTVPLHFQDAVSSACAPDGSDMLRRRASVAASVQENLGDVLIEFLQDVRADTGSSSICLGGGLFFNSYLNARVAAAGLFDRVFVPVNPGSAGAAVGAALVLHPPTDASGEPLTPFLGPEFGVEAIKTTLDNCKLSYDHYHEGELLDRLVTALIKGRLVGWFQGRMEWGSRALGHRSILASPLAEYALDNLNVFLKHREPYRPYSVAVTEEDCPRFFKGPPRSRFMEYDYEVLDRDLLRPILPLGTTRLRVQTVPSSAGIFHRVLEAFGAATGVPILINTSFNGFREPIVCSPRDAVRVFYGTGLDMAVIGNFLLCK
jgi:carbamoyltransferase